MKGRYCQGRAHTGVVTPCCCNGSCQCLYVLAVNASQPGLVRVAAELLLACQLGQLLGAEAHC